MKSRITIKELEPKSYEILLEMERYLAKSELPSSLKELVKIRASQINKCAYCLEMHTLAARNRGEEEQRIYALSAWEESPHFSPQERAALAYTEEVTLISQNGVREVTYNRLKELFSERQIAQLTILIGQINFWNRINVATKQNYSAD
ncbi:MAG: carboxymuconolactone decarboxylase family protein [Bacteroidales bacterium]